MSAEMAQVWRDEHGRLVWRDREALTDEERLAAYLTLARREVAEFARLRFGAPA